MGGSHTTFYINSLDGSRRSGLMLACISNSVEVVDLLLSRYGVCRDQRLL